jgi:hypothetical protein
VHPTTLIYAKLRIIGCVAVDGQESSCHHDLAERTFSASVNTQINATIGLTSWSSTMPHFYVAGSGELLHLLIGGLDLGSHRDDLLKLRTQCLRKPTALRPVFTGTAH